MKIKLTILNVAGFVQIVSAIANYCIHGQNGDEEGWGLLATIILTAFGIGAILLDWFLRWLVKNSWTLFFIEIIIIIAVGFLIYGTHFLPINIRFK